MNFNSEVHLYSLYELTMKTFRSLLLMVSTETYWKQKKRKVFEWIWLDYERSVSNFYFSAKWKWIIWKYSGELAEKLLTQICNNKLLQSFVNCMLKHSEIPPNHWNFFQLTFTDRPETNLVQPDECLPEVFQ